MTAQNVLHPHTLPDALARLGAADPALARWQRHYGAPAPWWRPAGYATLARIIIEQQVSLAAARAVCERLAHSGALSDPARLLAHTEAELRAAGLSRQKQHYLRLIAREVVEGTLDLVALEHWPDDAVRERLLRLKGVGAWTAEVYLLMALGRADAWPASDIGLLVAMQRLRHLSERPTPDACIAHAEPWRPYRGAAAWLLWHGYLREFGIASPE